MELTYLDKEGDKISIDDDESLQLALSHSQQESVLKIEILLKAEEEDGKDQRSPRGSRSGNINRPALCRKFIAGACKFGSSCRFSHANPHAANNRGNSAQRNASQFRREIDIEMWLSNQLKSSESQNISYLSSPNGFEGLLQILNRTNSSAKVINQLVLLLTREEIRTSLLRHATNKIYGAVVGSAFLNQLHTHIRGTLRPVADEIGPFVSLSEELMARTQYGWKEVPLDELKSLVDELPTDVALANELRYAIARQFEQRQKRKRLNAVNDRPDTSSPATDFRNLPVIPSKEQLLSGEDWGKLPVIQIGARYTSVATYLDAQFRLLREDCMATLRDGVHALRRNSSDPNLRVYTKVRLVGIQCGQEAIVYRVSFGGRNARRERDWESSKRLMFGSLLCISHDNFQTFFWAVIADRSSKLLSNNLIDIRILEESSDQRLKANRSYTMAESSAAYFEAYYHVLKNLQRPEMDDLPFQEHLVFLEPRIQEPTYLKARKDKDVYDFLGVFPGIQNELPSSKLHILQDWPQWSSSLDRSQIEALKHGLTKRLALIQGPPGTGKTYIGLLIVRIMLNNLKTWNLRPPILGQEKSTIKGPILIVCYTNHALDQFLKGISAVEKNMIRIGGRSKIDEMTGYSLSTLLKRQKNDQNMDTHLYETSKQAWKQKKELEEQILQSVDRLNVKLVTMESLHGVATEDQIQSLFYEGCNPSKVVEMWLNEGEQSVQGDGMDETQLMNQGQATLHNPYNVLYDVDKDDAGKDSDDSDSSNNLECLNYSEGEVEGFNGTPGHMKSPTKDIENSASLKEEDFPGSSGVMKTPTEDIIDTRSELMNRPSEDVIDTDSEDDQNQHLQEVFLTDQNAERVGDGDTMKLLPQSNKAPNTQENSDGEWMEVTSRRKSGNTMKWILQSNEAPNADQNPDGEWMEMRPRRSGKTEATERNYAVLVKYEWPLEMLVNHVDVWTLDKGARRKLYQYWTDEIRNDAQHNIAQLSSDYEQACKRKSEIDDEIRLALLRKAKVVGLTTTAASRHHSLLESLQSEIIIVEEAAEVLESHILACLTPSTKHLILIGDHLQLRPSVAVYDLALHHHLDVSLFERLVSSGIEYVSLQVQRRMRPSISKLISSLYPQLNDHASVLAHENIKGVKSNVFFLDHKSPEGHNGEDESGRVNLEEAKMVVELCSYLLKQGYSETDITILSMYKGQVREIHRRLAAKLKINPESVNKMPRISSVDDYQGEECTIIILSLVRSNHIPSKDGPGRIGFLKVSNRVCVALSRARNGLFIFGNGDLLVEKSDLWKTVIHELRSSASYGNELTLCCQNHPGTETRVSKPDDFKETADGGCNRPCEYQLDCGHVCPQRCHPDDDHNRIVCPKRCPRKLALCNHQCQSLCHGSAECPPCKQPVYKEHPKCGHVQSVACSTLIEAVICMEPCPKILDCGHKCRSKCGKLCTSICHQLVKKDLPCGHSANIDCHKDPLTYVCKQPCLQILSPGCEHICKGTCGSCHRGTAHIPCLHKCGRSLPCDHSCQSSCCKVCPPCSMPCRKHCMHSRCRRKCGEPCVRCVEPCPWKCEHHSCKLMCHELCDRPRCDLPCQELLACGHSCLGLCGEPCPSICRICTPKFKDTISQMTLEEFDTSDRFQRLQDCGHVFEVSGLDQWMDMEQSEGGVQDIKPKQCPECRTPILLSLRYGNIVKAKLSQIEDVKMRIYGFEKTNEGNRLLQDKKYEEAAEKFVSAIKQNPALLEAYFGLGCALCGQSKLTQAICLFQLVVKQSSMASAAENLGIRWEDSHLGSLNEYSWLHVAGIKNSRAEQTLAVRVLVQWASALSNLKEFHNAIKLCDIVLQEDPDHTGALEIQKHARDGEVHQVVYAITAEVGGKGHWYKCPNGHFYVVGECGGPMQTSTCPDCKAVVGGQSHTPAPGNTHSNIDGSDHPAWGNATGLGHNIFEY